MGNTKILFVNERPFNPILGGIERVTDILAHTLSDRGYIVYYLCGKIESGLEPYMNYSFPAKQYTLPESGLFHSDINLDYYTSLLEELSIDIVINQRGLGGGFNKILPLGSAKKISVLHSIPNSEINHNIARILLFSKEPKEQLKKYTKACLYPIFYYRAILKAKIRLRKAYKELAQHSDAIVLLSKNDVKGLLSNGIRHCHSIIHAIPNPNTFQVKEENYYKEKENIILYVGRLDPFEKNVLCLVKIWKQLYKKFPEWKLMLVGDGPDRDRITEYIRKKSIKNILLEGAQRDVLPYYRKASFICLTSYYEGWGMTLTEGMTYGCIPFTFNNYGAASDIIDDGINGCLINAFEVKHYAKRLSELMINKEERIRMSRAAVEKAKIFSAENVADEWEKLFSLIE